MYQPKVNNTQQYSDSQGEHVVCRGKLVLIQATEKSLDFIDTIADLYSKWQTSIGYKLPIIISETEEVEIGDWGYHIDTKFLEKIETSLDKRVSTGYHFHAKILVLPEHFSGKHLQNIVDSKMKDGDIVYLKVEGVIEDTKGIPSYLLNIDYYQIHLNQQNHIALFSVKQELKVLICNECKKFWLEPTKECSDCGCKILTRTHPSNAKYSKDTKQSLKEAAEKYSETEYNYELAYLGKEDISNAFKAGANWVKKNNY